MNQQYACYCLKKDIALQDAELFLFCSYAIGIVTDRAACAAVMRSVIYKPLQRALQFPKNNLPM